MVDTIKISRYKEEDIDELVRLINSAYRGESSKKGWTTEADLLDGIRTDGESVEALMQTPGAVLLSATDEDNHLVGCVYLQLQGRKLYLGMLTVAPDIQAKGIGKKLLLAAEQYAVEKGCGSIVMNVIDSRFELIDWYKRRGYMATGETKPFPTDPSFGIPKKPLQFIMLEKKLI